MNTVIFYLRNKTLQNLCSLSTLTVGERIMAPKDLHILIPGTFKCIKLHSKGELKLQVELRFLIS